MEVVGLRQIPTGSSRPTLLQQRETGPLSCGGYADQGFCHPKKIKGGRGPAAVTTYLYDHTTRRICDRQVNDKNDSNNSIYLRTCVGNHQSFRPIRRSPIQFSSAGFPHDYIRLSRVGGRPGCPRQPQRQRPSQTRICLPTACYSLARSTWMPWIRSEFPQYFAISSSSSEKKDYTRHQCRLNRVGKRSDGCSSPTLFSEPDPSSRYENC
ncbi:hypothetical protein B0T13DRAFT_271929 [Neurospora crassa]|nr:hypothetical protein B0T13DRAFT_271929 [Neurospora crassa]